MTIHKSMFSSRSNSQCDIKPREFMAKHNITLEGLINDAMMRATVLMPRIGAGLFALPMVRDDSEGMTFATNGARIVWSGAFVEHMLDEAEKMRRCSYDTFATGIALIELHELGHTIGDHPRRFLNSQMHPDAVAVGLDAVLNEGLFNDNEVQSRAMMQCNADWNDLMALLHPVMTERNNMFYDKFGYLAHPANVQYGRLTCDGLIRLYDSLCPKGGGGQQGNGQGTGSPSNESSREQGEGGESSTDSDGQGDGDDGQAEEASEQGGGGSGTGESDNESDGSEQGEGGDGDGQGEGDAQETGDGGNSPSNSTSGNSGNEQPSDAEIDRTINEVMKAIENATADIETQKQQEIEETGTYDSTTAGSGRGESALLKSITQTKRGSVRPLRELPSIMATAFGGMQRRGRSFRRPHRRQMVTPALLPIRFGKQERPFLLVCDTSGSMDAKRLMHFMPVAERIRERYPHTKCTILHCDDIIQLEEDWSMQSKAANGKFVGGGGTEFRGVAERLVELKPACVAVYTDMYFENDTWADPLYAEDVPIIWLVVGSGKDLWHGLQRTETQRDIWLHGLADLWGGTVIDVDDIVKKQLTA